MNYYEEIEPYRSEIDKLNDAILNLIKERVQLALKIGEVKQRYNKPIVDGRREEKVLRQVVESAKEKGLDTEGATRIFKEIIRLCAEAEKKSCE